MLAIPWHVMRPLLLSALLQVRHQMGTFCHRLCNAEVSNAIGSAGWVPPSLSHVASDAATHLQVAGTAARFEAANQDAVAQSAHLTAKHTLLSNLGDQGFQQGLSGLQAYSSQSESDSSSSGCDRSGSGAVGPCF